MAVQTMKRGGRILWAAIAAALSLLFHAALLESLPPMALGRPVDHSRWVDYPSLALGAVQVEPPPVEHPPARFRPENPKEVLNALDASEAQALKSGFDIPVPSAPEVSLGIIQGEAQALAEPAAPEPRAIWDPREEIIQIERKSADEQASVLPRRYTEAIARTVRVPDVTLPREDAAYFSSVVSGAGAQGVEALSREVEWPEGWGANLMGALEPQTDFLPEATSFANHLDPERVVLPATEQYLALDVQSFKAADEEGAVYFRIQIMRYGEDALPVIPKDILLLQDCSESITPAKLAECKRGLRRWLDWIGPEDRFQIIGFSDRTQRCFDDAWQPLNGETRQQALHFIDSLRAVGNTDVYGSLASAAALPKDPARPFLIVLITDGRPTTGVTGSPDIIDRFSAESAGRQSVFSVGAGRRANRFLLDLLSYRNRGDSLVVADDSLLPSAMDRWAQETHRPVLTDLRYRFAGLSEQDIYPRALTPLFLDRPLLLYGRAENPQAEIAFQVVGQSGGETRDLIFPLDLSRATPGDEDLRKRWAWHRIYYLIGEHTRTGDAALIPVIRSTAARYGLTVPYGYSESLPRW
ncbi:MAG: VWA domain-containing protein [Verrucomicrobia bacterium]|nr:VWA domain-containing protein [Kiritimatiellia bacterium]MCO6400343.1 VWA domain-containing protein [Verrucomicrobiota bacterium]